MTAFVIPSAAVDIGNFSTKLTINTGQPFYLNFPSMAVLVDADEARSKMAVGQGQLDGVTVTVDGASYFVGQDAELRGGRHTRTTLENFSKSPEYMALYLGGLYFLAVEALFNRRDITELTINEMVGGLPYTTYGGNKDDVVQKMTGEFRLPPMPWGKDELVVRVAHSTVIPQPQGALFKWIGENGNQKDRQSLVMVADLGGGTLDWFSALGNKPLYEQCGAHPVGMVNVVTAVCDAIDPRLKDNKLIFKRVDEAIRTGSMEVMIRGEKVSLDRYQGLIEKTLDAPVKAMLNSLSNMDALDLLLIVGGGATALRDRLLAHAPGLRVVIQCEEQTAMYANVMGFLKVAQVVNGRRSRPATGGM